MDKICRKACFGPCVTLCLVYPNTQVLRGTIVICDGFPYSLSKLLLLHEMDLNIIYIPEPFALLSFYEYNVQCGAIHVVLS